MILETIALLSKQGYAMQDVLLICKHATKSKIIDSVEEHLMRGESLRESILQTKTSKNFKEFFYFFSMQKEVSQAIMDSIQICQRQSRIFMNVKKKLMYPIFLLVFLFFFSIFVTLFLMPEVEILFRQFSIAPNLFFRITFFVLRWLPIVFVVMFILGCTGIVVCYYVIKKQRFKYLDFMILKVPVLSKYIKKYYSLKFAIYYQELLYSGYDTTQIITILAEQMMDTDIKMLVYEMQQEILHGKKLLDIIEEFDYFEDMLATYFLLLLENGATKTALREYLNISMKLIQAKIDRVVKLLIPAIYGFVITFVLLVYLCIILPMMDIINLM